jgi:tRNA pseudouridine55 synthase
MTDLQGWINLYKPKNISSFQAIKKIKEKFSIKKIGHAGTLDPLAEGILPIAIGKTTKLSQFISKDLKKYEFTICWGTQTSTDDEGGKIIYKSELLPNLNDIKIKLKNFKGHILQTPPKVSAVKINGKRAYNLARKNLEFNIKPKKVFIKDLKVIDHTSAETSFNIECGKGFYIRSLGRDLARQLGTYGHISKLIRTKVGKFNVDTSILLDDLLKIGERQQKINYILSSISMLDDILACEINDEEDLKSLSQGKSINIDENKLKNISSKILDDKIIFISNSGDIVSFGKLTGNLFKPNKILI